ncbi:class I adenylate-forming enzyme family protein [Cytobacillus purgationiresistens]|uniref:Fatty-acyl-CoA synthase n=1 Tax=Cytobacillus purgationiresistens TaxID=863449 RepID=A0ABU0ACN6_9BACI|nr:AMP-binding protein [Cytobacillus purgationiresistens]MDQ0268567.1 fatty-acyl-CoA synthase [Cytobacillus purgationiresistens]
MYVTDWLAGRASLTPNLIAAIDADNQESWTFFEMNKRANGLAQYFRENGISKGDRVALCAENHLSFFDFLFACWKLDAIFVPLNWRLADNELQYIINHCRPKIVGVKSDRVISLEFGQTLIIDATYEQMVMSSENTFNESEDDLAPVVIIYTGGTTGRPKGVVLTKKNILANAMNTIISWGLTRDEVTYTALPMFHTGGLNSLTLPVLLNGGTVVYSAKFEPKSAVQHLNQYHCTIVLFVPTMYQMIMQMEEFKTEDFPSMKCFLSGGAPCPHPVYDQFKEKKQPFKEGYGLSEAGPNNFYISPEMAEIKRGSVGKPMLLNSVKIMMNDKEIKGEEVGELFIKGDHVFCGYWENEHETHNAIQDGWLKTGDLARRDEDGYFFIVGRLKDMIITGGENVYPIEIENVLLAHADIKEAAVIGADDPIWGEAAHAYVSTINPQLDEHQLKAYCQRQLANYKVPKKIHFIDELPKTFVNKIDKKMLIKKSALDMK